jgi:hypothetical protein
MTTLIQLRKAALALPEVEEGTHFGLAAFSVAGKGFVSVSKDGAVQLRLAASDVDRLVDEHPSAGRMTRGAALLGVRVPLADLDGQQLNHWVRQSWLASAPKRLADAARVASTARAGEVGDLPKAIGNPATRALVGAGLTSLAKVRAYGVDRLGELHGVGPKALRILAEAVDAPQRP